MKKHNIKYIVYLLISTFFILILSKSTSPLYDGSYTIDSSVFMVIGKGITQGYIPYIDLFDHKGPILFFIQAIGILINEDIGIFILQIVNCYITILFLEKLINLFEKEEIKKNIVLLITLIIYAILFGEGNFSEEWSLGLITISLYIICKGLINNNFTKEHYFINGFIFAILSLIRLNNAATVIGFSAFQFFHLIKNKQYKELRKFLIYFLLGVIVVYIPIIIIFIRWNALYEMIYSTFIFNFIYSYISENVNMFKLCGIIPLIFLFYVIFKSKYSKNFRNCVYVIIFVNIICVSIGYLYLHYYIILIPLLAILIVNIKNFIELEVKIKNIVIKCIILSIILCGITTWTSFLIEMSRNNYNYNRNIIAESEAKKLLSYIKDKESVLCYNISARIYLTLDIIPCYKYFTMQSWHSLHDNNIDYELVKHIENKNVKYIITYKGEEQTFLNQYKLIYENDIFELYEII